MSNIDFDRLIQPLLDVAQEFADEFPDEYRRNLEEDGRVATERLIRSLGNARVTIENDIIHVKMDAENYYKYIEEDTRPHTPPFQPILEWVIAKRDRGDLYTQDSVSTAWAVVTKISKEGTKGKPTLKRTIETLMKKYETRMQAAMDSSLDILGGEMDSIINGLF